MKCEHCQCENEAENICIFPNDTPKVMGLKTISILLCMDHMKMRKGRMFTFPFYEYMEEGMLHSED